MDSASATRSEPRFAAIDVLRGIAVVAMIFYHASWDLAAYGLIDADVVNETGWRLLARTIAGTFLGLVGFNLVLATRNGFRPAAYFRRLAVIAGAALLVSAGTYWFVPEDFVYFGVLHCIAASSVLALPFLFAPVAVAAIAAVLCFVAPDYLTGPFFDAPGWAWLGLSPNPPATVDYVPILPWFGVVLGGIVVAKLFLEYGEMTRIAHWRSDAPLVKAVAAAGRWSLPIYLIHQPILVAILYVVAPMIGPGEQALARQFLGECDQSCSAEGYDTVTCATYCDCILTGIERDGLLGDAYRNALNEDQKKLWTADISACKPDKPPVTGGNKT